MTLTDPTNGFLVPATHKVRCPNPISLCPDYTDKNADTCLSHNTHNSLIERVKCINISLSLEDVSNCIKERVMVDAMGRCSSGETPRSILKKSVSADAASIRTLRNSIFRRRLSATQSESNLRIDIESAQCASQDNDSPRSPQKNVTFADDNNLSLVEVRNFVPSSDGFNVWNGTPIFPNHFRMSRVQGNNTKIVKRPVELLLCFKEPCIAPDFKEQFQQRCVALEKCGTRDRTVTGIIMVKNIEFEKNVLVRYTLNRWKTSDDVEACYVPNSNDGRTDRFTFSLSLPKSNKEMEFCIKYKTSSNEFWDNNYNRNYKVKDAMAP